MPPSSGQDGSGSSADAVPGEPAAEDSPAADQSAEEPSERLSVWERMRRAMADHNAKAPRGPMGIPQAAEAEPTAAEAGADDESSAELVLERIHHYRDTIRSYHVLIEGQRVGQIRDDKSERFVLRPGSYTMRLQLMWLFSPKVVVELPAGSCTRMICGPNGGIAQSWRMFLAPTTAIFLRYLQESPH